ncbi:MAG: T9SS type A sorting domain-containing protein [Bacteroidales bacterium]|nr:T9SS type A sorting domain-containing protein [Bacteroidales bacterium]
MLYPNPANTDINLLLETSKETDIFIGLYNIKGGLIFMEKVKNSQVVMKRYPVGNLSPGIYILKVVTPYEQQTFKVVKK